MVVAVVVGFIFKDWFSAHQLALVIPLYLVGWLAIYTFVITPAHLWHQVQKIEDCNPDFFPELRFDTLRKHALSWATLMQNIGITLRRITLHHAPKAGVLHRKYLVFLDVRKLVVLGELQMPIDADIQRRSKKVHGIDHPFPKRKMANLLMLEQVTPYFQGPVFQGFEEVYRDQPAAGWQQDWTFELQGHPPDFPQTPVKALPTDCTWVLYER